MSDPTFEITQLVTYCTLIIPTTYILIRHGWPGVLGWAYIIVFCILRIVDAALQLHDGKGGPASIISSIGLSPLLLASMGILDEARRYRNSKLNSKIQTIMTVYFHVLVSGGVGVLAAGSAGLASSHPKHVDHILVKVGISIMLGAFASVSVGAVLSLLPQTGLKKSPAYAEGTQLLFALLVSLPFTGIRTLFSAVSIFSGSARLNQIITRVHGGYKVELISVLILLLAGIFTHRVQRPFQVRSTSEEVPLM